MSAIMVMVRNDGEMISFYNIIDGMQLFLLLVRPLD